MANKSTFTCHVWTPQKVVEPGAAAEFGLSEKPTVEWDVEMRLARGRSRYQGYDPVWSNRLGDRP